MRSLTATTPLFVRGGLSDVETMTAEIAGEMERAVRSASSSCVHACIMQASSRHDVVAEFTGDSHSQRAIPIHTYERG